MGHWSFIFALSLFIIWGIFDYFTEVREDVPRYIRKIYWGPIWLLITIIIQLSIYYNKLWPDHKLAFIYCFALIGISILSMFIGRWAMEIYDRKQIQKSVIVTVIHYVLIILLVWYITDFIALNSNMMWNKIELDWKNQLKH